MEWLRFCVIALFLAASLGMAVISVAGVFKFKFILNRMHAAAIIDSFALLLAIHFHHAILFPPGDGG